MKIKGFTLAEVLITLGIIGVVAALTIPALMQTTNNKETVSKVKKAYNTIANAYKLSTVKYGTFDKWGLCQEKALGFASRNSDDDKNTDEERAASKTNLDTFLARLGEFMNLNNVRDVATVEGSSDGNTYWLDGSDSGQPLMNYATFADGTVIRNIYLSTSAGCDKGDTCANISIDVNGDKGPNTHGKDIFTFFITKDGVYPNSGSDSMLGEGFSAKCNTSISTKNNGQGCAAWVLYKENLDYLKCTDLEWDGKTKCD